MTTSTDYSAKDIKRLMLLSYMKYQRGLITETQAYRQNFMLANILRAIEASDQEERISSLERVLLSTKEEY